LRRKALKTTLISLLLLINYGCYIEYGRILKHQREVTARWEEIDEKRDLYVIENALPDEVLLKNIELFASDVLKLDSLIAKNSPTANQPSLFAFHLLYLDDENNFITVSINRVTGKVWRADYLDKFQDYPRLNLAVRGNEESELSESPKPGSREAAFEEAIPLLNYLDVSTNIDDYEILPEPYPGLERWSISEIYEYDGIETIESGITVAISPQTGKLLKFFYIPMIPPPPRPEPTVTKKEAYLIAKKWLKRSGKFNLAYYVAGDFNYGDRWNSYGEHIWMDYSVDLDSIQECIPQKIQAIPEINPPRYSWLVPFPYYALILADTPFPYKLTTWDVFVDTTTGKVLNY
jgi:hypothetical protein